MNQLQDLEIIDVIQLCPAEEVKEESPMRVEVAGYPPLAVFNVEGEFFVTDDKCSHGAASLADGMVVGDTIECPFHSGSFCIRTGSALTFPAVTPIKVYSVKLVNGHVCIGKKVEECSNKPGT